MEYWIGLAKDYYIVFVVLLYFTLGRFVLLLPVIFNIGSVAVGTSVILGIEFIQIPVFYNFYAVLIRFFSRLKERIRLKKKPKEETEETSGDTVKQDGFFVRHLRKYGIGGVVLLAAFPFRGCGVWSSVLLGRSLEIGKRKIYLSVTLGTVAGLGFILLFGVLFQQVARSFLDGMTLPAWARELIQ